MTSPRTPVAVRLPPGWTAGLDDGGHPVAGPRDRQAGDPLMLHRRVAAPGTSLEATAHALAAELASSHDELILLDAEPVTCRGSAPGVRLLTAWRDGERGLTAEHWLVDGGGRQHVLAAVMEAGRYAVEGPAVRRSLASFRHDRERSFGASDEGCSQRPVTGAVPEGWAVVFEVEVLTGPRRGFGTAVIEGTGAVVRLPGMDTACRVSRSLLPGWLAALVGLAPRPRVGCPGVLVVERDGLDALLRAAPGAADRALEALGSGPLPGPWRAALEALSGEVVGRWRFARRLVGPQGEVVEAHEVEVVDANRAGLWQVASVDGGWLTAELAGETGPAGPVALSTLSSTAVWEMLTGVCDRRD